MRIARYSLLCGAILCLASFIAPRDNLLSEVKERVRKNSDSAPIVIHSDTLEVDQQKRVIVFEGKVKAQSDDMVVDCEKMVVYYTENPSGGESAVESSKIDRIIAQGNVRVNRSDGLTAKAGKAVFYQGEDKIVLTDNPSVSQGRDVVEGDRITVLLRENRSIVEGSGPKRVKATLFPKEEKGSE